MNDPPPDNEEQEATGVVSDPERAPREELRPQDAPAEPAGGGVPFYEYPPPLYNPPAYPYPQSYHPYSYPHQDPVQAKAFYEAQMRDHAVAYASAAAGAAWAAAQLATGQRGPPVLPAAVPPSVPRRKRLSRHDSNSDGSNSIPSQLRIRRRRSDASWSSGSSQSCRRRKKAARSSLIGKTAVSCLYEWCSKQGAVPSFLALHATKDDDGFGFGVSLDDGVEVGRGWGATKAAAKQMAARQALQGLIPGVVFDEDTGILIKIPSTNQPPPSDADDLPNLAQRLAIGSRKTKRSLDASTSEDESQPSVVLSECCQLLSSLAQIDSRLPEPPTFHYLLQLELQRSQSTVKLQRGVFTCTARLRVRKRPASDHKTSERLPDDETRPTAADAKRSADDSSSQASLDDDTPIEVLEASAVGQNKRTARHTAAAKLLHLLFPGGSLADAKAAAEDFHQQYASRRDKQIHINDEHTSTSEAEVPPAPAEDVALRIRLAWAATEVDKTTTEPAPESDEKEGCTEKATEKKSSEEEASEDKISPAEKETKPSVEKKTTRCRRDQIRIMVEKALQSMYELDEEGRSVPDELTEDDVGKTVLRRATVDDLPRVLGLLFRPQSDSVSSVSVELPPEEVAPVKQNEEDDDIEEAWGSSAIVLVLCRAVALANEPPLGCAVLKLGTTKDKERTLELTRLVTESHLPRERFVECLQDFCENLPCTLEDTEATVAATVTRRNLPGLLEHFILKQESLEVKSSGSLPRRPRQQLSSVQEEEDGESESSSADDKRAVFKRPSQPSKRSRVK